MCIYIYPSEKAQVRNKSFHVTRVYNKDARKPYIFTVPVPCPGPFHHGKCGRKANPVIFDVHRNAGTARCAVAILALGLHNGFTTSVRFSYGPTRPGNAVHRAET